MVRQVNHLVRLVDDLLDVSRISRGKIALRKEQLDLAETVDAALEMSQSGLGRGSADSPWSCRRGASWLRVIGCAGWSWSPTS